MIHFVTGDIFESKASGSLAHCISSDAKMSQGLAKVFVIFFPKLMVLKNISLEIGTAFPVCDNGRFLYNLITKNRYWNKPKVGCLKSSLLSMRAHAEHFGVETINVPQLGAGLDGLDFYGQVLPVIEQLFVESAVDVVVHLFNDKEMRYVCNSLWSQTKCVVAWLTNWVPIKMFCCLVDHLCRVVHHYFLTPTLTPKIT